MARRPAEPDVLPEPSGFRVARDTPVGRHPLLTVFPGLDRLPLAERLEPDPLQRPRLFDDTSVEVVDEDMWMYVAPWKVPTQFRRAWQPVVAPGTNCIVVGQSHLRESSDLMLFMDIFHELRHVVQRRGGADLWPPGVSYVKRWTEVEAYRLVVDAAREMGASDEFLRDYLKVEWISAEEFDDLLGQLGVPAG